MSQGRVEKRMVGRVAHYERRAGPLSITPSGCDIAADADEDVEILVVAVDPGRMALAAAECALPEARLIERMYGDDPALFALARIGRWPHRGDAGPAARHSRQRPAPAA
jgi:AraC family transcriptional regulator